MSAVDIKTIENKLEGISSLKTGKTIVTELYVLCFT